MDNRFTFQRRCAYLNSIYYRVWDAAEGANYEVEFRTRLSDYEAGIYNGGPEAYVRECGPRVGMITAARPLCAAMVTAFNAWTVAKHEEALAQLRASPEKYGPEADWRDTVGSALQADGARYYDGEWRVAA